MTADLVGIALFVSSFAPGLILAGAKWEQVGLVDDGRVGAVTCLSRQPPAIGMPMK